MGVEIALAGQQPPFAFVVGNPGKVLRGLNTFFSNSKSFLMLDGTVAKLCITKALWLKNIDLEKTPALS